MAHNGEYMKRSLPIGGYDFIYNVSTSIYILNSPFNTI